MIFGRRSRFGAACAALVLSFSGAALSALPPAGSMLFEAGAGLAFYGDDDIMAIYGSGLRGQGKPKFGSVAISLGYAASETFQVGLLVEPVVMKRYDIDRFGTGAMDHWKSDALGLLLRARMLLPSEGGYNGAFALALGRYSLNGAGRWIDGVGGSWELEGANLGGEFVVEIERMLPSGLALVAGAGYRFARISPVTQSGDLGGVVTSGEKVLNDDGSNAALDLSGLFVRVAISYCFGESSSVSGK